MQIFHLAHAVLVVGNEHPRTRLHFRTRIIQIGPQRPNDMPFVFGLDESMLLVRIETDLRGVVLPVKARGMIGLDIGARGMRRARLVFQAIDRPQRCSENQVVHLPVVCRTIRDKIVRIAQDGQEEGQPGFVPRRPKRSMAADLPQRHRTIPGLDLIQYAHGRSGLSARSRCADSALAECRRKHRHHRLVHGHRFGCGHIAALHKKVYLRFVPRKGHIPPFVAIRTRNF